MKSIAARLSSYVIDAYALIRKIILEHQLNLQFDH